MKASKLKQGSVISAACLGIVIGSAHAAPLNSFSNGTVADADDVNANFTELETRINTISLTPGPAGSDGATGPMGPQGLPGQNGSNGQNGLPGADGNDGVTGPQGPAGPAGTDGTNGTNGTDGAGVITYPWLGYGSGAWNIKTFVVSPADGSFDKEVRTYDRTSTGATTGAVQITRQRSSGGTPYRHEIFYYETDTTGGFVRTGRDTYLPDGSVLNYTETYTPGLVIRNSAMGLGMTWGTSSQVDRVYDDGITPSVLIFEVHSYGLVAIENITVRGVAYTGCQKILKHRVGGIDLKWYCPGEGLVKMVSPGHMWEFDQAQSTPAMP